MAEAGQTHVLIVDDDVAHARMVETFIRLEGAYNVSWAEDLAQTLEFIAAQPPDVIILDLTLPDSDALDTFQAVYAAAPRLPIVIFSGIADEQLALQAVRDGAQDYLFKGQFDKTLLLRSLRYAIERSQLQRELLRQNEALEARVAERTQALQSSRDSIEAILDTSPDAIAVMNVDGTIRQSNPSFRRLFGFSVDTDLYGRGLDQIIPPIIAMSLRELLRQLHETGETRRMDLAMQRANGDLIEIDVMMAPLPHSSDVGGLVCSFRDITHQKHIEGEIRLALGREKQANVLKSRLISVLSHEYRVPLAVIRASTEMLKKYSARMSLERREEHFERITEAVLSLTSLTDETLHLVRGERDQVQYAPIDQNLVTLVETIYNEIRESIGGSHQLHLTAHEPEMMVFVDTLLIRRALNNLLSNAIKYSPSGSSVRVTIQRDDAEHASVRVYDEGIGIPEQDRRRLFGAFQRASNVGSVPGTGLGLALTREAVQALGGSIAYEALPDKGSVFIIRLPLATAAV